MAFSDIIGTIYGYFQLGIGGPKVKNAGGIVAARNPADTADVPIQTSQLNNSGNQIVLNSGATQSGASWLYYLGIPTTGMTANLRLNFPSSAPTVGQTLVATDTVGTLAFQNIVLDRPEDKIYALAYNSSSPVALCAVPVGAIVKTVTVFVDTAFVGTGAPTVAIGIAGNTSLFMAATANDLTDAAGAKSYSTNPVVAASGSVQNLIATYVANSATAGAARILIEFSTPSNP